MRLVFLISALLTISNQAFATTFAQGQEPDPFVIGAECNAPQLASYGSYIYQWPSKYDLVFEPWVTLIWKCKSSGYLSYAADFDDLSDVEKSRIAAFITVNPWQEEFDKSEGFQAQLDQMEAIYALRDRTREEQAYFLRARAWLWKDDPNADLYRKQALVLHKEILSEESPEGTELLDNLFVAGFYSWKLGDPEAGQGYFDQTKEVEWTDDDGNTKVGSDYLNELIREIKDGKADDAVRFAR